MLPHFFCSSASLLRCVSVATSLLFFAAGPGGVFDSDIQHNLLQEKRFGV
jgi:hypothetical protein